MSSVCFKNVMDKQDCNILRKIPMDKQCCDYVMEEQTCDIPMQIQCCYIPGVEQCCDNVMDK